MLKLLIGDFEFGFTKRYYDYKSGFSVDIDIRLISALKVYM